MFEEKDALVAAEQQLAFKNRNSKMGLRDRTLDMGRHVVGTFGVVEARSRYDALGRIS